MTWWRAERLGHLTPLDGIRCAAVLIVLAGHNSWGRIPGAAQGVEAFFVLSGFLITTLLLEEAAESGRIRLGAFYERRARRLLPALAVLLAFTTVLYAIDSYLPVSQHLGPVHDYVTAVVGAVLYANNWLVALGSEPDTVLFHTWSLSIEEQFYLLWPPILILLLRRRTAPATMLVALAGLFAASTTARIVLYAVHSGGRYDYRTDVRGASLVLGCALAIARGWRPDWLRSSRVFATGTAVLAMAAVAYVVLRLQPTAGAQYGYLVTGTATAIVIGNLAGRESALHRPFSLGVVRWIGERSYGLYLFHYPVTSYVSAASIGSNHVVEQAIRWGVPFILAAGSYSLVEQRFRRRRGATSRVATATGAAAIRSTG